MKPQENLEHLAGKVAVITGASRGIGQLIAVRLAHLKITTAVISRSETELGETAEMVLQAGGKPLVIAADLSIPSSIDVIKSRVLNELGPPSILINSAGMFGPIDLIWNTDPNDWIKTQMVNFVAAYLMCHAFIKGMMTSGWGRVINVTSAATLHEPGSINSAYGTSKAALNQFTRHLAAEIAGSGVTANLIHPGDVKTEMWATVRDAAKGLGDEADRYRDWALWVAETGGDDPEKASDLVVALLSERAAAINGRFLWIKDGLQPPIPSWGKFVPDEAWR